MLLEVECQGVEDRKESEKSMQDFAIKPSMLEIVSLREGDSWSKTFLAGGVREDVFFVIKNDAVSEKQNSLSLSLSLSLPLSLSLSPSLP